MIKEKSEKITKNILWLNMPKKNLKTVVAYK